MVLDGASARHGLVRDPLHSALTVRCSVMPALHVVTPRTLQAVCRTQETELLYLLTLVRTARAATAGHQRQSLLAGVWKPWWQSSASTTTRSSAIGRRQRRRTQMSKPELCDPELAISDAARQPTDLERHRDQRKVRCEPDDPVECVAPIKLITPLIPLFSSSGKPLRGRLSA